MNSLSNILERASIEAARIKKMNDHDACHGSYVVYWMKNSFRTAMNPSLNLAVDIANVLKIPLITVIFFNRELYPGNMRHYTFMFEGIRHVQNELAKRKTELFVMYSDAIAGLKKISADCTVLVTDMGYLKNERSIDEQAARIISSPFISVESNVIVPLNSLSGKEEYSAATIRPKIRKLLPVYLNPLPDSLPDFPQLHVNTGFEKFSESASLIQLSGTDDTVGPVPGISGGAASADKLLAEFITHKLHLYHGNRNNPDLDYTSTLSPYLHFGQISPVYVANEVMNNRNGNEESAESFLDELIIRRELSFNFVNYNDYYDSIDSIPSWAKTTLEMQADVKRDYIYSLEEFENSSTRDPFWNAAQNQLVTCGTIHNYMRMYWGKKIIEWSESPRAAYGYMVYLNNKYALDGNDPNSYAGIAWCFGKHDRPWGSRPVFGKVRYMNDRGLKRKFRMTDYLSRYGVANPV